MNYYPAVFMFLCFPLEAFLTTKRDVLKVFETRGIKINMQEVHAIHY